MVIKSVNKLLKRRSKGGLGLLIFLMFAVLFYSTTMIYLISRKMYAYNIAITKNYVENTDQSALTLLKIYADTGTQSDQDATYKGLLALSEGYLTPTEQISGTLTVSGTAKKQTDFVRLDSVYSPALFQTVLNDQLGTIKIGNYDAYIIEPVYGATGTVSWVLTKVITDGVISNTVVVKSPNISDVESYLTSTYTSVSIDIHSNNSATKGYFSQVNPGSAFICAVKNFNPLAFTGSKYTFYDFKYEQLSRQIN